MPELPEVETTRRGVEPYVRNNKVSALVCRQRQLRWPVPVRAIEKQLVGQTVSNVGRRGKYLLLESDTGTLLVHLGMSGNLRVISADQPAGDHDHVDIVFADGRALRLNDPRRFGSVLWTTDDISAHKLIHHLGPEPFDEQFNADYLHKLSRGRKAPVKTFVMDSKVVVGVGNIYANEALFKAGIHPKRAAGKISKQRYVVLVKEIKETLEQAIKQGGTTLKDFVGGDGKPGYFKQELLVYGRAGEPCVTCGTTLKEIRLGQRSTVYCKDCQK